jgi:F-type H+-transporting ATPase subunit gamma
MPNLKDLKTRINSVKSTQKITSAMKMVAAAKLRRAQDAAESGRPYALRMSQVISSLAAKADRQSASELLVGRQNVRAHLLVAALMGLLPVRPDRLWQRQQQMAKQ